MRENSTRLCFLTEEYGKIYGWYKKKNCPIDIGSICDIIIERKESTNIIHTMDGTWSPLQVEWRYKELFSYLEILSVLGILSSENTPDRSIIEDYRTMVDSLNTDNIEGKLTLFLCRFMKKSGILGAKSFDSSTELQKIYQHIDTSPMKTVMCSKKVSTSSILSIQSSLRYSLQTWNQTLISSSSSH